MSVRVVSMLVVCSLALCASAARAGTSGAASVYFYAVPGDDNYLQPTVRADADRLHIEARYNYEGKHTISFWGGYTLTRDSALSLAFTPMFGVVAGDMSGVSPGGELSLKWKLLEFYTENEYVHDFDESSNSFFYSWS